MCAVCRGISSRAGNRIAEGGTVGMPKKIYLRSIGGLKHGWGHVVRSSTLARFLHADPESCTVHMTVAGDAAVRRYVAGLCVPAAQIGPDDDILKEQKLVSMLRPDCVVVDMLEVPGELVAMYKNHGSKVILFNDMGYEYEYGDIIINPQLLPQYPHPCKHQKHLNGPEYFILSEDIVRAKAICPKKEIRRDVVNIIIVMGGCINHVVFEHCARVLNALASPEKKINFLLGYDHDVNLSDYNHLLDKGVSLVSGSGDIARYMTEADMALASAGYVKYELAALGVPTLMVSVVDHQDVLAKSFVEQGKCAQYLGNIYTVSTVEIVAAVQRLAADRTKRELLSESGQKLVGGKALQHIQREIMHCL